MKPYLTKVWFGRHWWYIDTKTMWRRRSKKILGRWCGTVSYRKVSGP